MDVNKLMSETHEHYRIKIERMHQDNKQLRRANNKFKNENRALKRSIHKIKHEKQKNHYKNGKRGTKFNG